jgi:hypothetical protein
MVDNVKTVLGRLRKSLSARAEKAYVDRDEAPDKGEAESYAAGESHAYGIAEDDVRKAEKANE